MLRHSLLLLFLLNFLLVSCDNGLEGNLKENLLPTTSLTVNEINLPEGNRLVSQVSISWWGDDPDGYITGYEFFIGDESTASNDDWVFTSNSDSTFILPIPEGNEDADVKFTVRAIDNDDARDDDPPSLVFPIRNTPPVVSFNALETPPDTTYRVLSFGFNTTDPDGDANLNRIEVALNDTLSPDSWKEVSLGNTLITLRIDDTQAEPTAEVFLGRSLNSADFNFDQVNLNAENEYFMRSIDNAGAVSEVLTYTWYLKQQTSNILFINDYSTNTSDRANLHIGLLNDIGITEIDYLDISDGFALGGRRVPLSSAFPDRTLADPTINMMLAEWDYIYWISENLDRNIGYALEITFDFFAQGGTMFVNIPTKDIAEDNSLLQFLPFQRVENLPTDSSVRYQSFYLQRDALITAASTEISSQPELRLRRNLVDAYPIRPLSETVNLFEAPFQLRESLNSNLHEYGGPKLISATNPDRSLAFFGIDFNHFTTPENSDCVPTDQDPDEVDPDNPPPYCSELNELLEILTIDILGFEQ
ncbi:MAG: hypothetical protein WD059_02415 [Balneolaceae bacterium]